MLVPDDLAAWFVARMNVAAVTTAVPGGFWNGRPLETATAPYAVFTVAREGVEYTSAFEMPRMKVSAAVMVDQATTTAAQGAEIIVGQAMPVIYTGATAMIRNGAGTVIFAEPREASADTPFPLRGKNDVVACRLSWEILCQAASSGV